MSDKSAENSENYTTKHKSTPIITPEEKRQAFRLRSLVSVLVFILIILPLFVMWSVLSDNANNPSSIIMTTVLASTLTTVLGSIIGTSLK